MRAQEGFVRNCHITARAGDGALFTVLPDGQIVPCLDGYVICPREQLQEIAASARVAADEPAAPV